VTHEEATAPGNRVPPEPFGDVTYPHIISIRGFPDAALIKYLGEKFHLAPDILLGHLPYPETFDIGTLASYQRPSLGILMISTGYYSGQQLQSPDAEAQLAADKRTEDFNKYIFSNNQWGVEQCHKVNLHGSQFFSVEQRASFVVHERRAHRWSGIILNNSGIEDSHSPWRHGKKGTATRFLPLKTNGDLPLQPIAPQYERNTEQNLCQRHPDLGLSRVHHGLVMSDTERRLCLEDPRVFASDLLKTSALSWKLFFSFLHSQHQSISGKPEAKADQFHRDKEVLLRARLFFRDAIIFLKHRSRLDWPTCELQEDKDMVEAILTGLLEDFEDLDMEAGSLRRECNDSIGLEMNMISILDSKKSIEQADRVQKLTFLAYLFVPVSFIASIFSMNVREINNSPLKLWMFFAIAGPVAICCASIPLWKEIMGIFYHAKRGLRHALVGYGAESGVFS